MSTPRLIHTIVLLKCVPYFFFLWCSILPAGKIKLKADYSKKPTIIYDSITHKTLLYHMVILAIIQRSRFLFQLSHMLNPKHFGLSVFELRYFGGTMKRSIWKWELSFCAYFIFVIYHMLLEALNLRLAINIIPDRISAWQLVSIRSQRQRKLW